MNATLDEIRQAAQRRRLVKIVYEGEQRVVEPYSLRPGVNKTLFYAWCRERQGIRAFNLGKVAVVSTLEETFEPRWPVEF